jgi:hypothetical protein
MQNTKTTKTYGTMIMRMDDKLKLSLEGIARNKGLSLSSLCRMWLIEKMQEELARSDNSK